jgi:hypothetical protein
VNLHHPVVEEAAALRLVVNDEMMEEVCEGNTDHWTGNVSDLQKSAVKVSREILSRYVGTYSGFWRTRARTVAVTLDGDALQATGLLTSEPVVLFAQSDTLFTSSEGVTYRFILDANGVVTRVDEIHRGGDYQYFRHGGPQDREAARARR